MDPFEPQLVFKKEVRFAECFAVHTPNPDENIGDVFGGILKTGQWGWLTKGSQLRIISLRTGQLISKYDFDESNGFGLCIITCVSEINLPYITDTVVAIGIQYADSPGGLAVIYSIEESTVLKCMELKHKVTCCKFISSEFAQHTVLQNMNGCLAVGTDEGSVLLLDLNIRGGEVNTSTAESGVSIVPCHIVDYSMSLLHLHRHFQHCQQEGVHFGIQLEVLADAAFIQSLQPIDLILSLAVGLADGRLVLYDLTDMQVFLVTPPQERSSPLVKINFMEPPDDPRPCVYIWAFHENYQNSMAVMHSLMYEKRVVADSGFCYFENFQVSSVRLLLPLNSPQSIPITCQAITKAPSHGNDETISLCALVWKQDQQQQTEVLLFDINQWYKEEMPYVADWREDPSYLASFVVKGLNSLEMFVNPHTISLFNSIQRPEEHFYPISLSFDAIALGESSCFHLNWPGAQNQVINLLRFKGSMALLDPNPIFREVLNTRLLPQFSGLNYKSTYSLKAKRETLLSVAIEQNCIGLLKECAKFWSDGSHQGKSLNEGLSLSTLTDWLWTRASSIKDRCNKLCQVLFNHSGYTLDQREHKELGFISKQLKTLADLLSEIIGKFGETVPSDVLSTLEAQSKLLRLASDYQEILLWLLNIGLLPEAPRRMSHRGTELNLVPYPYDALRRFYEKRRTEFTRLNEKFASRKTRSCYLLFIDSFIDHEFKGNSLRDAWQESGGDGLYPPISLQAMMRVMLIPDVTFEIKCALFLYFFLDLNMAIEDKQYEPIVQNFIKFPSVFKLSASLIKQIQAFWNLDHCRFQAAVDEFISPFNKDQVCPQWQLELFLESLLAQNESNLALRVLEAKSSPISPVLQLNTYLANDLISEAFHFARSKQDESLMKIFFTGCLCTGKFGVIRDLALTETEGNLVQSLLKNSKSRNAENLHFVYLLQKYKYIEAVSYLDELSKGRVIQRGIDVDTPTLVLSAYNTTLTPVTRGLSDVYCKIRNKIKNRESELSSPYPLSCQLIKQNANDLLGGIYHSSALSAHFASHYWERHHTEGNTIQQSTNAPFLRRPQVPSSYAEYNQVETISYPDPYKAAQKRRLDNSETAEEERANNIRENPKKRRKFYDNYFDLGTLYKQSNREQHTADNLLTHFKPTSTQSQDMTSFTKMFQQTPSRDASITLDTPYVRNTSVDESLNVYSSHLPDKSGGSLQGILKASNSNPKSFTDETDRARASSVESEKRDKKDTDEEKSIRFVLPTVDDDSDEQVEEQGEPLQDDDVEEEPQQQFSRFSGPSKRKSLRSGLNITATMQRDPVEQHTMSNWSSFVREPPGFEHMKVIEEADVREVFPMQTVRERSPLKRFTTRNSEDKAASTASQILERSPFKSLERIETSIATMPFEGVELKEFSPRKTISERSPLKRLTTSRILERSPIKSSERIERSEERFVPISEKSPYQSATEGDLENRVASTTGEAVSVPEISLIEETKDEEDQRKPIGSRPPLRRTTLSDFKQRSPAAPMESKEIYSISSTESFWSQAKISGSPSMVRMVPSPVKTVSPRLSLASERMLDTLPRNIFQSTEMDDLGEEQPSSFNEATESVRIIPVVFVEEATQSDNQDTPAIVSDVSFQAPKRALSESSDERSQESTQRNVCEVSIQPPKRALSESSDERSQESTQRSAKQLKGRASIHSSLTDTLARKTSPILEKQVTSDLPKTETIIDFMPHGTSSKVCATESKFNAPTTSSIRSFESDSKFHSEKVTSKVTFSERSTIVGGLTYLPTLETTEEITETVNISVQPKQQLMDTTVDMTLYDTLGCEKTPFNPSSSVDDSTNESFSDNKALGEQTVASASNASNEDVYEQAENSDEDSSGSVILLSSSSTSESNYDNSTEASEGRMQASTMPHILIDEDEESDGVDIIEKYDDASGDSNSFENQFSEVTRTSTSCSLPSNTDTGLSSVAEIEVDTTSFIRPTQEMEDGGDDVLSSTEIVVETRTFNRSDPNETEEITEGPTIVISSAEVIAENTPSWNEAPKKIEDTDSCKKVLEKAVQPFEKECGTKSPDEKEVIAEETIEPIEDRDIRNLINKTPEQKELSESLSSTTGAEKSEASNSGANVIVTEVENTPPVASSSNLEDTEKISETRNVLMEEAVNTSVSVSTTVTEEKERNKDSETCAELKEIKVSSGEKLEKLSTDGKTVEIESEVKIPTSSALIPENKSEESSKAVGEEVINISPTQEKADKNPKVDTQTQETNKVEVKIKESSAETSGVGQKSPARQKKIPSKATDKSEGAEITATKSSQKQAELEISPRVSTPPSRKQKSFDTDNLTPKPQGKRSKSVTKTLPADTDVAASPHSRRQSRGGSVPPPSTGGAIVTRRRSLLLETLDESGTPDSPSTRTRSRIRGDSIDRDVDSPSVSNTKRSRLSSVSSARSVEPAHTPRTRRRSSTSVEKDLPDTPKAIGTPRTTRAKSITSEVSTTTITPVKTPRRLSITRKRASPNQESSLTEENEPELETEPQVPQSGDYASSRRLTRTQLAVLEKSAALAKQFAAASPPARVTRRRSSRTSEKNSPPGAADVKGSDTESISSQISHLSNATSTRRVTRSLTQKGHTDDDLASIASSTDSTKRKRRRVKEVTSPSGPLKAIPEEQ